MKIKLKEKDLEMTVNSYGAYIEKFTKNKKPIFFPKLLVKIKDELKTRGGMHPCLPNFGKSEIKNLAQHGFGRISFWDIEEKSANSIKFKLEGKDEYENTSYYIEYKIENSSLKVYLKIENKSGKDLPIAPGFHPYFYVDKDLSIKDVNLEKINLEDTYFLKEKKAYLESKYFNIMIENENFKEFAIWTDYKGEYLCLEPCLNGPSFTKKINNPYILKKGQDFEEKIKISIKEK
ncbi:aldose epimerase [Anaerococcus rubeinfantis]|uniref:aldose epimerase family protein n=1 Tax=Anaerococcus rubeinfantis TaxID=1720199 RepID=UPI00073E4EF1|nr:aldose epimerase [Anaerococcus rubeinfantis]